MKQLEAELAQVGSAYPAVRSPWRVCSLCRSASEHFAMASSVLTCVCCRDQAKKKIVELRERAGGSTEADDGGVEGISISPVSGPGSREVSCARRRIESVMSSADGGDAAAR